MLHYICTCVVLFILLSMICPDPREKQVEVDRKHKEILEAVARLERQSTQPVPAQAQRTEALSALVYLR